MTNTATMTRDDATLIIRKAMSQVDANEIKKAMLALGELKGWTVENVRQNFVAHAKASFLQWKETTVRSYAILRGDDVEYVCLWMRHVAGDEIQALIDAAK